MSDDGFFAGSRRAHARFWGLVAGGVLLDQVTKRGAFAALDVGESATAIPGFFFVTPRYNPGMAWSILPGVPWILLVLLNAFVTAFVVWYRHRAKVGGARTVFDLATGLILSGAAGNLIDRLTDIGGSEHRVLDFMDFRFGSWPYPTFNVADVFLVCGVALYVYWGWWLDRPAEGAQATEGKGRRK